MKASIGVMIVLLAGAPALAQPPDALPIAAEAIAGDPAEGALETVSVGLQEMQTLDAETLAAPPEKAMQADESGALSLDELDELRGGEAIVIQYTTQALTANNAGNSVNGDTVGSGAVNLASNAFNGYDGIGNFVINTGHNNNLQGSISVSIAMTPQ